MNREQRELLVLGSSYPLLEECWTDEEGPTPNEIHILQRCLVLLGYANGAGGRSWLDGIVGPNTRRAIGLFQQEHKLTASGEFDEPTRHALFHAAVDFLAEQHEDIVVDCAGQLDRLDIVAEFNPKRALYYYMTPARELADEALVPYMLALVVAPHRGLTTVTFDEEDYQRRLAAGEEPARARMLASRYGFVQLSGEFYTNHPRLDLAKARVCGDTRFHLATIADLLQNDEELRQAVETDDFPIFCRRFPTPAMSEPDAPAHLRALVIEFRERLSRHA